MQEDYDFPGGEIPDVGSRVELQFQSLHQMNVRHRHCVFLSFCPVGPSGRGHIQNDLPQFMPLFFVKRLMHGSLCPSHLGGGGLVKSFDHEYLLSTGSWTVVVSTLLNPTVFDDWLSTRSRSSAALCLRGEIFETFMCGVVSGCLRLLLLSADDTEAGIEAFSFGSHLPEA
jgi:hypothetical protein